MVENVERGIDMGVILELTRARRRIKELELEKAGLEAQLVEAQADITDLIEQLALGVEKPSPANIVMQTGILANDHTKKFTIDTRWLNIPFTKPPRLLPIMEIPDTGSMDGLFDHGNNNLYIAPADKANHKIMMDWIVQQWLDSKGLQTVDAVTRIMADEADDPNDFSKPHLWYAIHRLVEVGNDKKGRYFWFAGINNPTRDPYPAREHNIIWLNIGTIA
jgi:hypothetical protein